MKNTKKFFAFDGKPPIHYRPGTSDEAIIQAVIVERKEYLFPKFEPKIIFDIGGNIGVVAVVLANIYPDAKIYTFEPVKENFELLIKNTCLYPNIIPMKVALGNKSEARQIFKSTDPSNLGGFSMEFDEGKVEDIISVVDVTEFCNRIGIPDLIKIDVEGAEFDIISAIPKLDKVQWITGELHGIKDYNILAILDRHFRLQLSRGFADKVWHFHAVSKSWTDFGLDTQPR